MAVHATTSSPAGENNVAGGVTGDVSCWYSRFTATGRREDVEAVLGVFGSRPNMSLAYLTPPPTPPAEQLVLASLSGNHIRVPFDWVNANWGCRTDILDPTTSLLSLREGRALGSVTFFTYGGPPSVWVRTAAERIRGLRRDVVLRFLSYDVTGEAAQLICFEEVTPDSETPDSEPETVHCVGQERVRHLLKSERFPYDPLLGASYDDEVAGCRVNPKVFFEKISFGC